MTILRAIILLLLFCVPLQAQIALSGAGAKRSQINLGIGDTANNGGDSGFLINNVKTSEGYRASQQQLAPSFLDQNGDLLTTAPVASLSWAQPQSAELGPNSNFWVVTADGYGEIAINNFQPGPQNLSDFSCTGTDNGVNGHCNNTACTGYQGYFSATTLTITTASSGPGCALQVGQPIAASTTVVSGSYNNTTGAVSLTLTQSLGMGVGAKVNVTAIGNGALGAVQQLNANNIVTTAGTSGTALNYTAPTGLCGTSATALSCTAGVFSFTTGEVESTLVNTWGVPTIITADNGTCNVTQHCYTVNYSQTIASSGSPIALVPGIRLVYQLTGYNASVAQYVMSLAVSTTTAGARVRWEGQYNIKDEAAYDAQNLTALGTLTTADYRAFMAHLNPQVLRDLGFSGNVDNNAATWAQRKSTQSINWYGYDQRPAFYAGTPSYTFLGTTHCAAGLNCYTVDWYQGVTDKEVLILQLPNQAMQGQNSINSFAGFTGATCTNGAYPNISITGGSGSGATALVICAEGVFKSVVIMPGNGGKGYVVGDSVSVTAGGGTQALTVNGVGYNAYFSADNGATYQPIVTTGGQNLFDNTSQMPANWIVSLTYDAALNAWSLGVSGALSSNITALGNGAPPEAFIQICAELKTDPWMTEPMYATDPQTDYVAGQANFIRANYPWMHPWWETPDEIWNGAQLPYIWLSTKGTVSVVNDPTHWTPTVPIYANNGTILMNEQGKIGSTLGQAINTIYHDNSLYEIVQGVQTADGDTALNAGSSNDVLKASWYVSQSLSPQAGYVLAPAYNYVTRVAVTNYWNTQISVGLKAFVTGISNLGETAETPLAYRWFFGDAATRAALQSTYASYGQTNIANYTGLYQNWQSFATTCASGTRPPSCVVKSIVAYEGGNSTGNNGINGIKQSADTPQAVSGSNNGNPCTLTLGPLTVGTGGTVFTGSITDNILVGTNIDTGGGGGQQNFSPGILITGTGVAANTTVTGYAVDPSQEKLIVTPAGQSTGTVTDMRAYGNAGYQGMPFTLSGISETGTGISWTTLSNLTVGSGGTPQSQPVLQNGTPLDCSTFKTLTAATITYTGSANWVNTLRNESWTWPEIGQVDSTLYQEFVNAGGVNPSQLNESFVGPPWMLSDFDIYHWHQIGNCTACNISGSTLTLGGTVTGEFTVGHSLLGQGVATYQTASANTTIASCTKGTGSGPCGTEAGDTLGLSQPAQSTQTGVNIASFYTSPLASFEAVEVWNNGN